MMTREKVFSSGYRHEATRSDAQSEQTPAPESVINKIVGSLGLARKRDGHGINKVDVANALADPAWKVRVEAVQKLSTLGKQAPLELLIVALHDEQSSVRVAAARALGNGPRPAAVPSLIASLDDAGWLVRTEVARALGSLREQVALEPLLAALRDTHAEVRTAAIWALGQMGTDTIIEPLNAALQDEDWLVREAATLALSQLQGQAAIQPLLNASRDRDISVREVAKARLQEISTDSFPVHADDTFEPWMNILRFPQKQQPVQNLKEQLARTREAIISYLGQKATAVQTKGLSLSQAKGLTEKRNWPRKVERVAEGLLAVLVIACLLLSWFMIKSWKRFSYVEQNNTSAMTTYSEHTSSVEKLAWSPGGLFIASADLRGVIMIWQVSTGETLTTHVQAGHVLALTWNSPTSVLAAYGEQNRELQVLEIRLDMYYQVQTIFQQANLPGVPETAAWSSDGQKLAFDTGNGLVRVWNIATHTFLTSIPAGIGAPEALNWSPDGSQLAVISSEGLLQLWSSPSGQNVATLFSPALITAVAWITPIPRNAQIDPLLFLTNEGDIMQWSPANGSQTASLLLSSQMYDVENSPHLITDSIALSQNGRQLALSTSDGVVQARDAVSGNPVDVFMGTQTQINDIEWSPDGKYIATASTDTTVDVWQEP